MSDMPSFETKRLVLRPLRASDGDALHAIYGDAEATRWSSRPPHTSIEETRKRVTESVADPDWRTWAITLKGNDIAIGTLGAYEKRQGGVIEIGYALAPARWGNGIAREAVRALVTLLFAEGNRRVFADTDPENAASNHLLEHLGFVREALLRGEWETHLGVRDSYIWGMLAEEWKGA
jgi:[ribosomal protein S5]-alanine N-acetyltransferase